MRTLKRSETPKPTSPPANRLPGEPPANQRDNRLTPEQRQLIEDHVPIARSIAAGVAKRVGRTAHERGRLFGEVLTSANAGLVAAAQRFDPRRQVPFGAYARRGVRLAILADLRRIPNATGGRYRPFKRLRGTEELRAQLGHVLGCRPTDEELAESREWSTANALRNLRHSLQDEDALLSNLPARPARSIAGHREFREWFSEVTRCLDDRSRRALWLKYIEGLDAETIASAFRIQSYEVRELLRVALARIREHAAPDAVADFVDLRRRIRDDGWSDPRG